MTIRVKFFEYLSVFFIILFLFSGCTPVINPIERNLNYGNIVKASYCDDKFQDKLTASGEIYSIKK